VSHPKKSAHVIHPFLFAVFPTLFAYSHNLGEISAREMVTPVIISAVGVLVFWLLMSLVMKDKGKAGAVVSFGLILFFSYGHLYGAVEELEWNIWGEIIGVHQYLIPACSLFFVLGFYLSLRSRGDFHKLTRFLNAVALSLFLVALVDISWHRLKEPTAWADNNNRGIFDSDMVTQSESGELPDIYYILLDGYARADVLKEMYGFDNSEFIDYLSRKGFYVAEKSRSNYSQTVLSVASSLNFEYLNDLIGRMYVKSRNRSLMRNMIRNSRTVQFLKQQGYLLVAFSSGYSYTELEKADVYINANGTLSEFQNLLVNNTPLPVLLDKLPGKSQFDLHRERLLGIFERLPEMTAMDSPVFVFTHILAPHPPFVFGEHGEPLNRDGDFSFDDGSHYLKYGDHEKYRQKYLGQLAFINKKMQEVIDNLISDSPKPPIIIIQADHGPGSQLDWKDIDRTNLEERMSILNAYFLPSDGQNILYQDITPVNTFRVIFNTYFEAGYELLKDESYFSTMQEPYRFTRVKQKIDSNDYSQTTLVVP
jgi:hypothetical protein